MLKEARWKVLSRVLICAWREKLSDMDWNCFLLVPWPPTSVSDYSSFRNSKQGWSPQHGYAYHLQHPHSWTQKIS